MKAALFICMAMASQTYATFIVATGTTAALTATQAASFYYGVAAVKALALGGLAIGALASRSRRAAEAEMDETFNLISQTEPQQCFHRLICDLATGQMPKSDEDVIMNLFENTEGIPPVSPVFDFAVAAEVGKLVKNVEKCEIQYTCPMTGAQLQKMLVQ